MYSFGGAFLKLLFALFAVLPRLALSAPLTAPTVFRDLDDVFLKICDLADWAFTFLIIISIVFVLFAAYKYLGSAGDPERVKGAKHTLIYAAVAVAVAIVAKGVPLLLFDFFDILNRGSSGVCGDA